jgi:hypothetical protein
MYNLINLTTAIVYCKTQSIKLRNYFLFQGDNMKKFWTCTIATCTLLAFSTNFANAAEQSQTNSVTAESLTSIKKQPVNSDTSAEHSITKQCYKNFRKINTKCSTTQITRSLQSIYCD